MKLCCCCNIAPILIRLNQKYLEFQFTFVHHGQMVCISFSLWYHLADKSHPRDVLKQHVFPQSRCCFHARQRNTEVKQCFVRTWIGRRASKTYTSYQTQTWKRVHDIIVRWVSMMLVKDLQYTINCPVANHHREKMNENENRREQAASSRRRRRSRSM